jgi:hypothetical protein
MVHEFALEPALVATWGKLEEYRYFHDKFGLGQPRLVSQLPKLKNWRRQVLTSASQAGAMELERITALINILAERMILREGSIYDGNIPWLENAEKEHVRCPFHAILALTNPRKHPCVLFGPVLGEAPNPMWDLRREDTVPRSPKALAGSVAGILRNCSEVVFIDPHFASEDRRYTRPLKFFMNFLVKDRVCPLPHRVELQTLAKSSSEFFRSECETRLPKIVPDGLTLVLKRLKQNETGQRLHNRYILTDIGGVKFGTGLDENRQDPVGDTDDVSLMNREVYCLRWSQYAGPNPVFELAEEPIAIVGRAKLNR